MSLSVVRHAAKQGKQSVMEVATVPEANAKCSLLYVLSVARKPKCRLNHEKIDQCIVASAIISSN